MNTTPDIKLSDKQKQVIKLMQSGGECKRRRYGGFAVKIDNDYTFATSTTISVLLRNRLITYNYTLTELGKTIKL